MICVAPQLVPHFYYERRLYLYEDNILEWNLLDSDDELLEEICAGLRLLKNRNSGLTFIASVIYEAGFSFEEIQRRINEIDGMVYEVAETWHNDEDQTTEQA